MYSPNASMIDETHDPQRQSWVESANGHAEFPIQNLPLGVFRPHEGEVQPGVAIGDSILSLLALAHSGLLDGDALAACLAAAGSPVLNTLLQMGHAPRAALRTAVSRLLSTSEPKQIELLYPASECELLLPARVGDYTDFYAGIHHATNVGKLFRPDNPLLPNYKWVPIGYHGRSSSVRASGVPVRRPRGQSKSADEPTPTFAPTRNLDFELELGVWIGAGNTLGEPVPIEAAEHCIAGYCLLNDWSARDVQSWEYQPLGPFLAKSFHTTVSPWIITPEALAPFRQAQSPRSSSDPLPLPYLMSEADQAQGSLSLALEVFLQTELMRATGLAPQRISTASTEDLYWTPAQLVTHHTSNGCNLSAGDLMGTGTISSAESSGLGSLLEITGGGRIPLILANGESRRYLNDGDEVMMKAHAHREGFVSIGFGECHAIIAQAFVDPQLRSKVRNPSPD